MTYSIKSRFAVLFGVIFSIFFSYSNINAQTHHVKVEGFGENREEAITDAKRLALEQAGVLIQSRTTVINFQVYHDLIESEAEGKLKFDIVDIGTKDGMYCVLLIGDVSQAGYEVEEADGDLRYAKSFIGRGDENTARARFEKIIGNYRASSAAAEARYYLVRFAAQKYDFTTAEDLYFQIESYHPRSPFVAMAADIIEYYKNEQWINRPRYGSFKMISNMTSPFIFGDWTRDFAAIRVRIISSAWRDYIRNPHGNSRRYSSN